MNEIFKITSIIAIIAATALPGFSADVEIEKFLNSPGPVEEFKKAKGAKPTAPKDQISPLVKQAQAFALYLNPPPKPKPKRPRPSTPSTRKAPRPKTVSAKFKLKGTSFYASRPEMSLALIDEPGKGLKWVRQNGKIGHLIIQQVKDGCITVRDGQSTFDMTAERAVHRSLVKGKGKQGAEKMLPPNRKTISQPVQADFEQLVNDLQDTAEDQPDSDETTGEEEDLLKQFMQRLESSEVSSEEAAALEKLGQLLKETEEPNKSEKTPPKPRSTRRRRNRRPANR